MTLLKYIFTFFLTNIYFYMPSILMIVSNKFYLTIVKED